MPLYYRLLDGKRKSGLTRLIKKKTENKCRKTETLKENMKTKG